MKQAFLLLWVILAGSTVSAVAAEDQLSLKRWAILSSPAMEDRGIADLLTVEMGKTNGFELVERAEIEKALKELALGSVLGSDTVEARLKLGKLLKADALVMLDGEAGGKTIRLVVSECRYGARLSREDLPVDRDRPDEAVATLIERVNRVRNRFRDGVRHIIGLTPFISDDLVRDYTMFQDSFTRLLEESLIAEPGIAVVETDQAHAIGRELEISGEKGLTRIVPLFVAGSYRIADAIAKRDETMTVQVRITRGDGTSTVAKREGLSSSAAAAYIQREIAPLILKELDCVQTRSLSVDEQFKSLISRADQFSSLNDTAYSIPLREAALLLKPDASQQRLRLVREHTSGTIRRVVRKKYSAANALSEKMEDSRRNLARIKNGYHHLAHLIDERSIPCEDASRLVWEMCFSRIMDLPDYSQGLLEKETKEYIVEWVRTHYVDILALPGKSKAQDDQESGKDKFKGWVECLEPIKSDVNVFSNDKDYWDFFCRVFEDRLPDDAILARWWWAQTLFNQRGYKDFHGADVTFMDAMGRSKKESNRLLARYLACINVSAYWYYEVNDLRSLLAARKALDACLRDAHSYVASNHLETSYFSVELNELESRTMACKSGIERLMNPKPADTPDRAEEAYEEEKPKALKEGSWQEAFSRWDMTIPANSRVRYQEAPIRIRRRDGSTALFKELRKVEDDDVAVYLKCPGNLDVFASPMCNHLGERCAITKSIFFMKKKGIAEEVTYPWAPRDIIQNGDSLWVSTDNQGVWLLDLSGRIRGQFGKEQGLPPTLNPYMVYPLSPDKAFVVGAFSELAVRAWLAIVEWKDGKGSVDVFHEARENEHRDVPGQDERMAFSPAWVHEFQTGGKTNDRILLVGRGRGADDLRRPLVVNVSRKTVSVFPIEMQSPANARRYSYVSTDRGILEAGYYGIHYYDFPGSNPETAQPGRSLTERCSGDFGKLLPYTDGWIYAPGNPRMYRINPQTLSMEDLGDGVGPGLFFKHYHVSNHYGLLMYYRGFFLQVTIAGKGR